METHEMMGYRLRGLLTAAFALMIAGSIVTASEARAREVLTIGINQYPANLNPSIGSMLVASYVMGMAHRQITIDGPDWKPQCQTCTGLPTIENGLAETFESTNRDGAPSLGVRKTYTLRDDLFWGDGTPVTTDDVVFAWEVGKHPDSGVATQISYQDVIDIEVADTKTFTIVDREIDFKYPSMGDFQILPAHLERPVFEADPKEYRNRTLYQTEPTNPGLYNGPYVITDLEVGATLTLERNPHWTGTRPAFDRVVVRAVENTSALEASLLSGQVDMIAGEAGLSIDQAIAFEQRHADDYRIVFKPGLIYEHMDVMLDNPLLADVRVRKALLYAVDRQAISERLFAGKQPVAATFVNPLDWVHTTDGVETYPHDPERAAALLEEAGWVLGPDGVRENEEGARLSISLMTTAGNRSRELVQQVLADFWKRVGIETRIRNEPARVYFGETVSKRRFEGLAMFAWLSAPENVPRTTLHSEAIPSPANNWSGQNYTGYQNPRMDALIEAIERELDPEKRAPMWAELQRIYAEDIPVLPLYFRSNSFIFPHWLKNIAPTGHKYATTNWIEHWKTNE
jgi:peptide/nickel transport system substrate-binding protein